MLLTDTKIGDSVYLLGWVNVIFHRHTALENLHVEGCVNIERGR